jgi:hypothetical protein
MESVGAADLKLGEVELGRNHLKGKRFTSREDGRDLQQGPSLCLP